MCIGLHVRHGDSFTDHRDNGVPTDRSFEAHMTCLSDLVESSGSDTIFLATDNITLFDQAANWYPQYRWFYQRRPLLDYSPLRGFDNVHNSPKSVQEDLADILADAILMSRCNAMVKSNSALTDLFYSFMCNRHIEGQCPLSISEHGPECQTKVRLSKIK